jgi:glyoxylase-like metal-dependent hydrolase (beta-lactamase superfamily II)
MKTWITKKGTYVYRVLFGRSNVFLIKSGSRFLLIDTSWKHSRKKLIKKLDRLGCNQNNLVALVLTHVHFDHVQNAASIKEKYHPKIIIHQSEGDFLKNGDNILPAGTNKITRFLTDHFGEKVKPLCKYQGVVADVMIDEQLNLNDLGFKIDLIHTPGHSSGSLSVIVENEITVVGDTLFGVFKGSVFPPFSCEPKLMVGSWQKLLDSGCSLFLPAHGMARTKELLEREYKKFATERGIIDHICPGG